MSQRNTKLSEGLVTSDAVQGRRQLPSRQVIIGICIAVLLAGGIAAAFWYYRHKALKPTVASEQAKQWYDPNDNAFDANKALANAQSALQQASTAQKKASAYEDLGTAYMNQKQYDKAIQAYQSALSAGGNIDKIALLTQLINAEAMNGNKAEEIQTMQQLIQALQQSNNAGYRQEAAMYQQQLKSLQGEQ